MKYVFFYLFTFTFSTQALAWEAIVRLQGGKKEVYAERLVKKIEEMGLKQRKAPTTFITSLPVKVQQGNDLGQWIMDHKGCKQLDEECWNFVKRLNVAGSFEVDDQGMLTLVAENFEDRLRVPAEGVNYYFSVKNQKELYMLRGIVADFLTDKIERFPYISTIGHFGGE